jgi:hypothetical protein
VPSVPLSAPYPSFNHALLDEKLALYRQRLLTSGAPDVLIIGSSRAFRGIDPEQLQQALIAQGIPAAEVFNFGINGATVQVVDLIVRRLLPPDQLPRLILWADGVRAFNSGRLDITFNAIAASKAYQKLQAGTLPTLIADAWRAEHPGFSIQAWSQGWDNFLNHMLASGSATYYQRDFLHTWFQQQVQRPFPFPQGAIAPAADENGFLALSEQFNPQQYYQHHTRVTGDHDGDYEGFRLDGEQDQALRQLLRFTRDRHIPVVFVNLPLTHVYLDSARLKYEVAFQHYIQQFAQRQDILFLDLGQLWPSQHRLFSDPSHLNRYGAESISQHLAQDQLIPWADWLGQ